LVCIRSAVPNDKCISIILATNLGAFCCIGCCATRQVDCAHIWVKSPLLRICCRTIPKAQPVTICGITTKQIHTLHRVRQIHPLAVLKGKLLSVTTIAVPHPQQCTICSVTAGQINTKTRSGGLHASRLHWRWVWSRCWCWLRSRRWWYRCRCWGRCRRCTNCPVLVCIRSAVPNDKCISIILATNLGAFCCIGCCATRQVDCAHIWVKSPLLRICCRTIPKAQPVTICGITTKQIHTLHRVRQIHPLAVLKGKLLSVTTIAVPHPQQCTICSVTAGQINTKTRSGGLHASRLHWRWVWSRRWCWLRSRRWCWVWVANRFSFFAPFHGVRWIDEIIRQTANVALV